MDNISINKANHLYWLGRYAERAYTTIGYLRRLYDEMVDKNEDAYSEFCITLGIDNDYKDKKDFIRRFISDENSEISIAYYIRRSYDNAVVLRDMLTSKTLSYIQLACNDLKKCYEDDEYVILNLQRVTDDLIAFWGAVDDYIVDNNTRDLIKTGKYTERVELYSRFSEDETIIKSSVQRLSRYVEHLKTSKCIDRQTNFMDIENSIDYNSIKNYISELSGWGIDH
ncbi:alpha-E domain-containing protein [Clostridium sp.]|jgi:uncharacterized alpha-E superfamily protein|uniref:alpha-E domain-containing protein n=1 Tax=Clostridium sp. TaxID=1506 RepID=UPI00258E4956|nr:alpha-E domain-containing protein [Clostridium sp.]MDF2504520.1 hypothetical protein [Clostridium sp.]